LEIVRNQLAELKEALGVKPQKPSEPIVLCAVILPSNHLRDDLRAKAAGVTKRIF
jgi:hypothetical protein